MGRRPGGYHLYVGGGLAGDRVADLWAADVPLDRVPDTLRPLLAAWAGERRPDEGFGDWYARRAGRAEPRRSTAGDEKPAMGTIDLEARQ